jgi:hypothetical protein
MVTVKADEQELLKEQEEARKKRNILAQMSES